MPGEHDLPNPPHAPRRRAWWSRPRNLGLVWLALVVAVPLTLAAPSVADADADAGALTRGAEIYAFSCSTCHGATGLGFAEARATFPSDHAACERCHAPRNPPQMSSLEMERNQMAFSLGRPPPLAEHERLARFETAGGLFRYLRATMPRWDPGSLSDDAYRDVTLHVLDLAGLLDVGDVAPHAGMEIDLDRLDSIVIRAR
jgi:hypothetical protein